MATFSYNPSPTWSFATVGDVEEVTEFFTVENPTSFDSLSYISAQDPTELDLVFTIRYTTDNINWTNWLTEAAFLAVSPDKFKHYKLEIRLTYVNTNVVPPISVTQVDFGYTLTTDDVTYYTIFQRDNLFSKLVRGTLLIEQYKENQWQKCQKAGLISDFVERTEDFESFWKSVAEWIALHYYLGYRMTNIYDDSEYLASLLEERGMYLCGDETLTELQTLSRNFYKEMAKRGTSEYTDELKRIVCYDADNCDEFISFVTGMCSGWIVDRSSPMYNFYGLIPGANRLPTKEEQIGTDELALLSEDSAATQPLSISSQNNFDGDAIDMLDFSQDTNGEYSAIKMNIPTDADKLIPCDQRETYFMSFFVKAEHADLIYAIGFDLYECDKTTTVEAERITTGVTAELRGAGNGNYFFNNAAYFSGVKIGEWVWFLGFIRPEGTANDANDQPNILVGSNIRFKTGEAAKWIYPIIRVEQNAASGTNSSYVYRLRMGVAGNEAFTINYVDLVNFVYNEVENKGNKTLDEIQNILDRYLLPASATNKIFEIG